MIYTLKIHFVMINKICNFVLHMSLNYNRKCTYKDIMILLDVSRRTAQRYMARVKKTLPDGELLTMKKFCTFYHIDL